METADRKRTERLDGSCSLVGYILKNTKENESPGNVLLLLWNGWNGTGSGFVLMGLTVKS